MAEQTVKLDPTHHDFGTLTKRAERLQRLVNLKETRDDRDMRVTAKT